MFPIMIQMALSSMLLLEKKKEEEPWRLGPDSFSAVGCSGPLADDKTAITFTAIGSQLNPFADHQFFESYHDMHHGRKLRYAMS
jgi:hypothetical protein